MTWPGCGSAVRGGSGHFVVVASRFRGNLHRIERGRVFVGELGYTHRSAVQASQALIFLGREEHDIIAAVTGHDDGLSMRKLAELPLHGAKSNRGQAVGRPLRQFEQTSPYYRPTFPPGPDPFSGFEPEGSICHRSDHRFAACAPVPPNDEATSSSTRE